MNLRFLSVLATVAVVAASGTSQAFDLRQWHDGTEKFSVVGTLDPARSFAENSKSVFIVDERGRTFECPLDRLSSLDADYLRVARQAYEENDAALEEQLNWAPDPSRAPGVRRVVSVGGVEYPFRWIPAGKFSPPSYDFDPNVTRAVASARASSRTKKSAPTRFVRSGFWMLETEVTLEMYNQFVTETKYVPRSANNAGRTAPRTNDPWANIDEPKAPDPRNAAKSRKLGYSATPPGQAGLRRGDEYTWKNPGFPQTKKHPVTLVTRRDVAAFCQWLSKKTGKTVTLPTTDQWFLAAQPERRSLDYVSLCEMWIFGGAESWERGNLPDANYPVICPAHSWLMDRIPFVYRDSWRFTTPVGSFKPNRNGLYDMVGNVGEMTSDDPDVVESRGGSWFHLPGFNPICWAYADALGYESLDRALRDYQTSRVEPLFAEQVAQEPYYEGDYPSSSDSYSMQGDGLTGGVGGGVGLQIQGNPFAEDVSIKPFIHVTIPNVDATCFTGFRVIIE